MDLVRSWATATVVFLVASLVTTVAAVGSGDAADGLAETGDRAAWNAVPLLVTFLLMTVVAGLVHPAPQRHRPIRHGLAVLALPVVLCVVSFVYGLMTESVGLALVSFAAGIGGTAAGWGVVVLLRRLRTAD